MVTFRVTVFMMLPVVLASISKNIMPNGAFFSLFCRDAVLIIQFVLLLYCHRFLTAIRNIQHIGKLSKYYSRELFSNTLSIKYPHIAGVYLLQNHCCGAQGPDDWDFNIYFNCSSESKSREKCGVPFSCCIPDPAVSCFLVWYPSVIEELRQEVPPEYGVTHRA